MNHRSLAFRLAVWYALLLSATFALVGGGMLYGLGQYLHSNLRDSLRRRSLQVEQILEQASAASSDSAITAAINTRVAPEFNNRFVRVTRAPTMLVYASGEPADRSFESAVVPPPDAVWPAKPVVRNVATASGLLLLRSKSLSTASGPYLVELGTALGPVQAVQHRVLALLGLMFPVLLGCAAGGGYLLVHWALRPVERLTQTAEHLSVQSLDARLPVVPSGDALQRLSISLNRMLARLQESIDGARQFLDDASHELRTPLTVIKGELQQLLADQAGSHQLRERIAGVLEEVGRLEHLVSGLLLLSRLDAGDARREWSDVSLGELAVRTAEQMQLLAEDRGVRLQTAGLLPLTVRGDGARLKQVIVNLLDNAVKFTPPGGTVALRTEALDGVGTLEICDSGIGIPPFAVPRVFDRFYRVDAARCREDGGAGLGLSIVRSICSAHGADIEVDSVAGRGTCIRLKFPLHCATDARAAALAPPRNYSP